MKKLLLLIFILLSVSCSKRIMVSSSELQTKMKMDSERQRIEQRDKKIFLLSFWVVYGAIMSKVAYNY